MRTKMALHFISKTLTAAGLLSAVICAGTVSASDFVPSLDPDTACEINIVGTYSNFEALEAEVDRFCTYYPDVEIVYTKLDDYNNLICTALEGENAPDIYFSFRWMEGREEYAGIFSHAQNLAETAGLDLSCIRKGLLTPTEDGQVLKVPVFSTTYGMLVNQTLFEKESLEIPETFPELVEVCASLKQAGYDSPVMGYALDNSDLYTSMLPLFYAGLRDQPALVASLNALEKEAGESMRPTLEQTKKFAESGCLDLEECRKIEDNYNAVIMRFFEGDVPMMISSGDTVSGTQKRESQSEAFTANPFNYVFAPFPSSDEGAYFMDVPSVEFSVNKDSANLEMADEFLRFLITPGELMHMSDVKRLVSPANNLSFEGIYAPFGEIPEDRIVETQKIGLLDASFVQLRAAITAVMEGTKTIDEAIAGWGQ